MLPIPLPENLVTRQDRTRPPLFALAGLAIAVTGAGLTPSSASAENYDIDCKLILCMPAGFPSGCSDAFDHMIDRLRDGKSPIGFCALSDGSEYDSYDIEYSVKRTTSPQGWQCPVGKTLYHTVQSDDDGRRQTVNTFCYDNAYTRRSWTSDGYQDRTFYVNKTPPERTDFWVNLTVEPGTPAAYSPGWQKFDANVRSDGRTTIRYTD